MGYDNYKFRYNAYKNNTFDFDVLEKTLDESKMTAYQYLRQFQLDSTGYKRFDFKMSDIYKTERVHHNNVQIPRKWVFFIEHEFINVGKRLEFKRSKFYDKEITYDDIISRPDLFESTFLLFIDGKLYTKGINILCKEDKTYLILVCKENHSREGFNINEMYEYIEKNVNVTLYFIPNIGIKTISTNAYRVRTTNKSTGIPNRLLKLSERANYQNPLTYIKHKETHESIPTQSVLLDTGLYISDDTVNYIINNYPNNTAIDIQLIPLRNLLTKIHLEKGDKWFEIPLQDYPVAVENCLIVDSNGVFIHDARINHYYPNVYSVENIDEIINEKDLFIYVFYYENKLNKLKHIDILATYHKYVPNYLDKYRNGTIPDIVKYYDPPLVDYSIKDYRKNLGIKETSTGSFYFKSNNGKTYSISLINGQLQSVECDGILNPEEYIYVKNKFNNKTYKIFMNDDVLSTELVLDSNINDLIYLYDKEQDEHVSINTQSDTMAIFEYLWYNDHFKYKINKMKEFISSDINNFRRYLRNLGLGNNYYYVDVSKIDLSKRIRRNNKDTKLKYDEFDKDMYMFVFRNDFNAMYDKLIVHIDGVRYPKLEVYKTNMLDYLYLPCDIVKPDSVIEVEKITPIMKEYRLKSERKFDILTIDLGEFASRNNVLYNDLFMVDRLTGEIVDTSKYQIILPITIHFDDDENDVVVDYILSENDDGYYYIKGLNSGFFGLVKTDNVEDDKDVYYLRTYDSKDKSVYQFESDGEDVSFKKINEYGNVINKVRSFDEENVAYEFNVVNGNIKINVISSDSLKSPLIVGYGGLDILELGEVFLKCPQHIKLRIVSDDIIDRDLTLMIKKNFKNEYLEKVEEDLLKPVETVAVTKSDPRYFRIYRNNRLIPRHLGCVNFPDNRYTKMEVFPGFIRTPNDIVMVECMPYMMHQVCYLESIPNDKVIDLTGMIDKPFDFKWYDIYLNGKKLIKKDVEIITANKIRILKTESLQWLEIIENTRDKEYFGYKPLYDILDYIYEVDPDFSNNINNAIKADNLQDNEESIVVDPILPLNYILRDLYDMLYNNFGLINPDELQVTEDMMIRYKDLFEEHSPFELNPDRFGKKNCIFTLPINPDDRK